MRQPGKVWEPLDQGNFFSPQSLLLLLGLLVLPSIIIYFCFKFEMKDDKCDGMYKLVVVKLLQDLYYI